MDHQGRTKTAYNTYPTGNIIVGAHPKRDNLGAERRTWSRSIESRTYGGSTHRKGLRCQLSSGIKETRNDHSKDYDDRKTKLSIRATIEKRWSRMRCKYPVTCKTLNNRVNKGMHIYIVIHRQTVSFYQNSSVRLDSRNWDQNLADCNANPRLYHSATRKPEQAKEI